MPSIGWIRIHRKIEQWPLYLSEPFTKTQAWIDMLIISQHHQSSLNIRGNIVVIKRGEIAWSEDNLAERWKWSRGKVRRFLNWLETEQQIIQHKSAILSKISIVKYEQYQQDDTTDDTTDGQQTIQQTDTYKECKNVKKVKNKINTLDHFDQNFDRFWEAYPRKAGKKKAIETWKRFKPTDELTDRIVAHLKGMCECPQWTRDAGQYIPHPTTYLNQERWNDEIEIQRALVIETEERPVEVR